MSTGTIGAAFGIVLIVVGIVWKVWATRMASRMMEEERKEPGE